ncbi:GLPGLI family protein [Elizabethkingia meningoseptica]|uniref:GLPGLI family protein n=1 Tax=Elizabethkingia meningoseptica TaxID=238 RepID=UPI001365F6AA|nr:GLPGLI family protein [Elizabethkingia meningoseptica]MDE5487450.1 GLPGLI family protein [Elizabethkingia meningoseptica]MVW90489.1 GLPGLI family protein [Elizabethkingia meningoseptica]
MNKLYSFLFITIGMLHAQNQNFIYEYRFIPDSTNTSDIKTEITHLEVMPESSLFYSYETYKSDSLLKDNFIKTRILNLNPGMRKGLFRDKILKTYPEFKIIQETNIGLKAFKVSDDRKIKWEIHPDQEKIGTYNTQKATTDFAGRKWIAWFTTEIPIQDGPYKFHGLPGLIIKLEDASQSHTFELKGISRFITPIGENKQFLRKTISISYQQYVKLYQNYRNDPTADLRDKLNSGVVRGMKDDSGNPVSAAQILKNEYEKLSEKIKKDNNILELDLLK